MACEDQNFELYRGENPLLEITIKDQDGNIVPLTGASFSWFLAYDRACDPILTKTLGSGITVIDSAGGVVGVQLDEVDTLALDEGLYFHELKVTDQFGNKATTTVGTVKVSEGVLEP